MNGVIEILVGIRDGYDALRDELDALIVGLVDMDARQEAAGRQEESEEPKPAVKGGCEHKHTQMVGGMGGSPERTVCVDCKEEV